MLNLITFIISIEKYKDFFFFFKCQLDPINFQKPQLKLQIEAPMCDKKTSTANELENQYVVTQLKILKLVESSS